MYLGGKESKECPHKTVSRFYNSPQVTVPMWRCDWCGQDFTPAAEGSKTVELKETVDQSVRGSAEDRAAHQLGTLETWRPASKTAHKKEKSIVS